MNLVGNPVKIIKHSSTFYKMKLFRKEPQNHQKYIPYSRCYKPPLYLFLRLLDASSRPRAWFFLASFDLLVQLLFKRGFSRASYDSENTVCMYVSQVNDSQLITEQLGC